MRREKERGGKRARERERRFEVTCHKTIKLQSHLNRSDGRGEGEREKQYKIKQNHATDSITSKNIQRERREEGERERGGWGGTLSPLSFSGALFFALVLVF